MSRFYLNGQRLLPGRQRRDGDPLLSSRLQALCSVLSVVLRAKLGHCTPPVLWGRVWKERGRLSPLAEAAWSGGEALFSFEAS